MSVVSVVSRQAINHREQQQEMDGIVGEAERHRLKIE